MVKKRDVNNREVVVILHNIRSVHNVGSMFRTADTVGVSSIYLTGYTPQPIDRFGRAVKEISKTALGAEKTILWQHTSSISKLVDELKEAGFFILAIEQSKKSVDYKKVKSKNKIAFVFGNEVSGLPQSILKKVDIIAEIPMRGRLARNRLKNDLGKESLNVSVAFGVSLFRILGI